MFAWAEAMVQLRTAGPAQLLSLQLLECLRASYCPVYWCLFSYSFLILKSLVYSSANIVLKIGATKIHNQLDTTLPWSLLVNLHFFSLTRFQSPHKEEEMFIHL